MVHIHHNLQSPAVRASCRFSVTEHGIQLAGFKQHHYHEENYVSRALHQFRCITHFQKQDFGPGRRSDFWHRFSTTRYLTKCMHNHYYRTENISSQVPLFIEEKHRHIV